MIVAVTGGSGLVGRRIVEVLLENHDVVNVDVRPPARHTELHRRCDILDARALTEAFDGARAVIHAAAVPGPKQADADVIASVNVQGTRHVLEAAAANGIPRLVHISSEAVLGFVFSEGKIRPRYLPIDEDHPLSPSEPYGRSKLMAETVLAREATESMTIVCLRPPWVWVPEEYDRCRELTRDPGRWWDGLWAYVHGDDLARSAALAATSDVETGFHAVYVAAPDNGTARPTADLVSEYYADVPVRATLPEFGSLISSARAASLLGSAPMMSWRSFLKP